MPHRTPPCFREVIVLELLRARLALSQPRRLKIPKQHPFQNCWLLILQGLYFDQANLARLISPAVPYFVFIDSPLSYDMASEFEFITTIPKGQVSNQNERLLPASQFRFLSWYFLSPIQQCPNVTGNASSS